MAIAFLVMKISRRLSRALMAGAVICSPSLAFAQDTVLFFGGVQSCTVWQSSPRNQLAGQTWILGFFSGHNYAKAHKVGQSTNASGIIGEVKKYVLRSRLCACVTRRRKPMGISGTERPRAAS